MVVMCELRRVVDDECLFGALPRSMIPQPDNNKIDTIHFIQDDRRREFLSEDARRRHVSNSGELSFPCHTIKAEMEDHRDRSDRGGQSGEL
jgi:hypothetical protein